MTKEEILKLAGFDGSLRRVDAKLYALEEYGDAMASVREVEDCFRGMALENARILPMIRALAESNEKLAEALKQCAYLMNKPNFITHDELIQACGDGSGIAFKALAAHAERMKGLGK